MNRNLQSPTKLTEFARNFDEEPETIFTKLVNRFTSAYNSNYNHLSVIAPTTSASPSSSHEASPSPRLHTNAQNNASTSSLNNLVPSDSSETKNNDQSSRGSSKENSPDNAPDRAQTSVLQRISNLVAMRSNNLHSYKDTNLQRFWMPDAKSKECYECSVKFSMVRRKHHCRLCGQIFCSKCCNQVVPGKIINCSDYLKVCNHCSKLILTYLNQTDLNNDLQAIKEDLSHKLNIQEPSGPNIEEHGSPFLTEPKYSHGYREERLASIANVPLSSADRKSILQQSNSLKLLHEEMFKMLPNQNRGTDLIVFLITNQKSSNKIQAITILNAMVDAGFIITLIQSPSEFSSVEFDENCLYKLLRRDNSLSQSNSFQLDLNIESNSVQLSRQNMSFSRELSSFYMDEVMQEIKDSQMQNNLIETAGSKQLVEGFCEHEELLMEQMLNAENLDRAWGEILIPHCAKVAHTLRTELCGTELMDIRNFVNFKKIPGGSRTESKIVGGVVFSKNVVHKEMACEIKSPRILLLQCAIVYQRVEGKLIRFETLLLQEKEYLRNVTARILSLKPNVVLVHKNVAGIAQDMLRTHGITLVLDVKLSVLQRLALNLQCDIVNSIDTNIGQPKLGVCDKFYIRTFDDGFGTMKSLMFFETPSNPRGCCMLLRGGNMNELARVKKVASFLLYMRFNWRLELSFLLAEFAQPPLPKSNIFDSKEDSPVATYHKPNDVFIPAEETSLPLKKQQTLKKSEEKSVSSINIENVPDFSDPLRAESNTEMLASVDFAVETPYDNKFRTALNSTMLSISPNLTFPLPYLETECGKKCVLRSLFPNELYYSKHWSETIDRQVSVDLNLEKKNTKLLPVHAFVTGKIVLPADSRELQTAMANFRASGGRFPKILRMEKKDQVVRKKRAVEELVYKDALNIENHQRLPVLFCSYYFSPKTTSSFCASPSLLDMYFYGQNDIRLGSFLDRYCFRTSYICPSCNLPMLDHVRRYVHSNGCILVALIEDLKKSDMTEIHMHSSCTICHKTTPSVPLSKDTWCLSFAKYLELRFHGHSYKRRIIEENDDPICTHSLHKDYVQYFSYNGIVASFEYTQLETWEVALPSLIIQIQQPPPLNQSQATDDIRNFAVKGYEVYAKIYDKLALLSSDVEHPNMSTLKTYLNHDQLKFRSKVEKLHTILTEPNVIAYDVSDALLLIKKSLAETIDIWGPKLSDITIQTQQAINSKKMDLVQTVDSGQICTEDLVADKESDEDKINQNFEDSEDMSGSGDGNSITDHSLPVDDALTISRDKENIDKKSILTIFSQIIQSNSNHNSIIPSPLPANEYHNLPTGLFPVLVRDQDLSSIIAYTLVSTEYLRLIDNVNSGYISDPNNSPNLKRKSQDVNTDDERGESNSSNNNERSEKKSKQNSHIQISFQDAATQFSCRVYFAKDFDSLRSSFLCPPKLNGGGCENKIKCETWSEASFDVGFDRKASDSSLNQNRTASTTTADKSSQDVDDIRRAFVRSLSQSYRWDARGGKSGSNFSKSLDDRFVLKEMSKQDLAIFEHFAPNYFEYLNQSLTQNQPTLLAKILGVFRVTIKKKDYLIDKPILVMENLFCDREISNKFDLKGSERNRLVDPNNQNGEIVLLDENLIQMSWSKPLYILGHSRAILRQAINRDASFLEKNGVMDYSLLVGLNTDESVLVLGIIDYIRTYTLEKRIESLVKQSGLLGGQGKLPTIISPKMYKQRFIEAMDRYFLNVPDRWEGLGKI